MHKFCYSRFSSDLLQWRWMEGFVHCCSWSHCQRYETEPWRMMWQVFGYWPRTKCSNWSQRSVTMLQFGNTFITVIMCASLWSLGCGTYLSCDNSMVFSSSPKVCNASCCCLTCSCCCLPQVNLEVMGGLLIPGEAVVDSWLTPVYMAHQALRAGAQVSNHTVLRQWWTHGWPTLYTLWSCTKLTVTSEGIDLHLH